MRIVCPACAAAYEVPDGRLAPGRVVRCARCVTDWAPIVAEEAVPVAEPEPVPFVETEPVPVEIAEVVSVAEPEIAMPTASADQRFATSGRTKDVALLGAAWAASLAALLAALWFGYSAREMVMHAWPPSIRGYAALGLVGLN